MSRRDRVREQIADELRPHILSSSLADANQKAETLAEQILSLEGLAVLDEDQSTPSNPYRQSSQPLSFDTYEDAQQAMLDKKWRKVL